MIVKSFIFFLTTCFCYSLYLKTRNPIRNSQNQNQDNLIKAQEYLYENTNKYINVIVGTSLSCHILSDSLPNFYNLAFNGSSIYEGLDVILKKKNKPRNVFVEINFLMKEASTLFESHLFSNYSYYIPYFFDLARFKNQPISCLISKFDHFGYEVVQKHQSFMNKVNFKLNGIEKTDQNEVLFEEIMENHMEVYNQKTNLKDFSFTINKLKRYFEKLKKSGVKICFFEVPVNYRLLNTRKARFIRVEIGNRFKNTRFIPIDTTYKYITSDGLHLNNEESLMYTKYFKSRLDSLNNKW